MTEELTQRAERAIADLESAGGFLRGAYFAATITQAVQSSVLVAHSPWLDRAGAAVHCRCSTREIDRAVTRGVIKRFERGETPLFLKSDLNTAIASGRWRTTP